MSNDTTTIPSEHAQPGVDDSVGHAPPEVADMPPSVSGGLGDIPAPVSPLAYATFDRQLPPPLDPVSFGRDHAAVVDHLKAWVRREITLAVQYGMFGAERAEHNP
jgi:hypothetical protein